jgi:ribonucleoside-diphosphate reductase beta chain
MEQTHSETYTAIAQNVFNDPSKIFDTVMEIRPIVDCAKDISKYYDQLIRMNNIWALKEEFPELPYDEYEHKKAIWLALMSVNALEGIRFYVSFACSWAFAETGRLGGIAQLIKLICRDENLHLGSTQQLLKMLPKDDPTYLKIREETWEECRQIFVIAAEQEMEWARYLFKDGSMLGLSEEILVKYVKWLTTKRMKALKYESPYDVGATNPLSWTEKWIAGGDVQVAPQELEITSYTAGDVKKDITQEFLSGLSL